MNHQTTIQTGALIKIVKMKWHMLHFLLKHPVIFPLHYHSIEPSWILPFPVSSFVESSSLKFPTISNNLQELLVKVKAIIQLDYI